MIEIVVERIPLGWRGVEQPSLGPLLISFLLQFLVGRVERQSDLFEGSLAGAFAAGIVAVTAKISLRLMMASVLFGYLVRLALIFLAVYLVKDAGWISFPALGATIIFTHLGLLVWELKYVAISLAYPALKPKPSELSNSAGPSSNAI